MKRQFTEDCPRGTQLRDPGKALAVVTELVGPVDGMRASGGHQHTFHLVLQTAADLIRAAACMKAGTWNNEKEFQANRAAIQIATESAKRIKSQFNQLSWEFHAAGRKAQKRLASPTKSFAVWAWNPGSPMTKDDIRVVTSTDKESALAHVHNLTREDRWLAGRVYTIREFVRHYGLRRSRTLGVVYKPMPKVNPVENTVHP